MSPEAAFQPVVDEKSARLARSPWRRRGAGLWLAGALLAAGPAAAETVFEVIQQVAVTHPNVMAAQKLLSAADKDQKEATAAFYPELAASAWGGLESNDKPETGASNMTAAELELKLTHTLYDGGRLGYKVDAANSLRALAGYEVDTRQIRAGLDAAAVYLDVLRTTEQASLASAHFSVIQQLARQMGERAAIDIGLRSDLSVSENQAVEAQIQAITTREANKLAMRLFQELVGRPPGKMAAVRIDEVRPPKTIETALQVAAGNNPALKAAASQVDEQRSRAKMAQTELSPNLDLELKGRVGNNVDGYYGATNYACACVRLSFKFGTGGGTFYRQDAAQLRVDAAKDDQTAALLEVRRQVLYAWSRWETANKILPEAVKRSNLADKKLKDYQQQFESGAKDLLEALFVRTERYVAKKAEIDARYEVLTAGFGLTAAVGTLRMK